MKKSFYENVGIYFKQYCNRTSVHGFQYFGEKKRTLFERLWWVTVFIICLSVCGYTIYEVYKKWDQSPVIVNFANTGTPIYKIPFPAVTICPDLKINNTIFNYLNMKRPIKTSSKYISKTILQYIIVKRQIKNQTDQHINRRKSRRNNTLFEYASLICNHVSNLNVSIDSEDFFNTMEEFQPKFQMTKCSYFNKNCTGQFVPIVTDEGLCYTFNMLDREQVFRERVVHYRNYLHVDNRSEWTLSEGYKKNKLEVYPRRAYLAGAKNGLTIEIQTDGKSNDYACRKFVKAFKVVLHTPTTIPRPGQKFFRLSQHHNTVGAIHPTIITTSERVKKYNPLKRQCYFGFNERSLRYFYEYTYSNCRVECLTNYTLQFCQCVHFSMPRENGTEICNTDKTKCMNDAARDMQKYELDMLVNTNKSRLIQENNLDCDCLPICSDLTYEVDTTETEWAPPLQDTNHQILSLTLYFKSDQFLTSERNELYGPLDFLANFGGVIGLFCGFSILSLMEILYFLTVRIITNIQVYGRWTGPLN